MNLATRSISQWTGIAIGVLSGVIYATFAAKALFVFNGRYLLPFLLIMLIFLCPLPLSVLGIFRPRLAGQGMIGAGLSYLVFSVCLWAIKGSPQGVWPVVRFIALGVSPFLISGGLLTIGGKEKRGQQPLPPSLSKTGPWRKG
jgi:hypothetical protein